MEAGGGFFNVVQQLCSVCTRGDPLLLGVKGALSHSCVLEPGKPFHRLAGCVELRVRLSKAFQHYVGQNANAS